MTYCHRIIIGSSDCTWVVGGAECTTLAMGRCSSWMVVVLSTSLKGTQTSELEDFRAELQCRNEELQASTSNSSWTAKSPCAFVAGDISQVPCALLSRRGLRMKGLWQRVRMVLLCAASKRRRAGSSSCAVQNCCRHMAITTAKLMDLKTDSHY